MKHWGHPDPKRSISWSNVRTIKIFNKGKLSNPRSSSRKPTTTYLDSAGRQRFVGNKFLRATQYSQFVGKYDIWWHKPITLDMSGPSLFQGLIRCHLESRSPRWCQTFWPRARRGHRWIMWLRKPWKPPNQFFLPCNLGETPSNLIWSQSLYIFEAQRSFESQMTGGIWFRWNSKLPHRCNWGPLWHPKKYAPNMAIFGSIWP